MRLVKLFIILAVSVVGLASCSVVSHNTYKPDAVQLNLSMEDLEQFKGSKYCAVKMGAIYADVKALLETGEQVLFIGLPCGVAGLRAYLKQDYDGFYDLEIQLRKLQNVPLFAVFMQSVEAY